MIAKKHTGKTLRFYLVALLAALTLGLGLGYWLDQQRQTPTRQVESGTNALDVHATLLQPARKIPPFSLDNGALPAFTNASLQGQWSLLFFGFTHCPGVCPATMSILKHITTELDEIAPQVMFISVDPARDTPEKSRQYTQKFHPSFLSAVGDEAQLNTLTRALGAVYQRQGDDTAAEYLVDHTAWLMLTNPQGQLAGYFSTPHNPVQIVADLRKILGAE